MDEDTNETKVRNTLHL